MRRNTNSNNFVCIYACVVSFLCRYRIKDLLYKYKCQQHNDRVNVFILEIFCWRQSWVVGIRESNSHRRSGRGTDKTVLSRLAWRCESGLSDTPSSPFCVVDPVLAGDGIGTTLIRYRASPRVLVTAFSRRRPSSPLWLHLAVNYRLMFAEGPPRVTTRRCAAK